MFLFVEGNVKDQLDDHCVESCLAQLLDEAKVIIVASVSEHSDHESALARVRFSKVVGWRDEDMPNCLMRALEKHGSVVESDDK
jgi:hypothetical protein